MLRVPYSVNNSTLTSYLNTLNPNMLEEIGLQVVSAKRLNYKDNLKFMYEIKRTHGLIV